MAGFDNQGYQYNTRYELLLGRYGRAHERRDLLGLSEAEEGYSLRGNATSYLPRIRQDLTDFVLHRPANTWPGPVRQSLLSQISRLETAQDVYALIDQLDPPTGTGSGNGSGSE